jgi:3-deoxy-7-phosphoheptulonate synthase
VRLRNVSIGGDEFVIMAGPGAIESEEQIRACARQVKECGGKVLYGGCFRPPTSPYGFQGLGPAGLEMLAAVGRQYELPVATEVFTPAEVEVAAPLADLLLVGPQNMQNISLLTEVGSVNRAVMLMRGVSASLDQLLGAAEHILARGNQQVMLCERGISTFETTTRYTLDLGAIPILRQMTHLPIVVDPSHAAGQNNLVLPLALAAHAVRPHAMMLELHPHPEQALTDENLALDFDTFRNLAAEMLS